MLGAGLRELPEYPGDCLMAVTGGVLVDHRGART